MTNPALAREKALTLTHNGTEYPFRGSGCLLGLRDDLDDYLDATSTLAL